MSVATISPVKQFAEQHGLKVSVVKAIMRVAERVSKTGEDHWNKQNHITEHRFIAVQKEFLAIIKANGFTNFVVKTSFYPILVKGDEHFPLPE